MHGLLYALLSVIATALLSLTLKHCAVNNTSPWTTLTIYHLGGFAVLLPFLGIPDVSLLSFEQIALLLATGAIFSLAGFFDILAMKHLDASAGEVFHTLTFIVSVAAGFLLFHETCSLSKIAGTIIIAVGILYEARRAAVSASRGFGLKLASAALIACAMIITKHLTADTPPAVIILAGFLLPGMLYAAVGYRKLNEIPLVFQSSHGMILLVPILEAAAYSFSIKALASGEMSTTYMLFQTTISVVLVIEVVLYGWKREVHLHRTVSAGLCTCGALIALVGQ